MQRKRPHSAIDGDSKDKTKGKKGKAAKTAKGKRNQDSDEPAKPVLSMEERLRQEEEELLQSMAGAEDADRLDAGSDDEAGAGEKKKSAAVPRYDDFFGKQDMEKLE